LHEAGHKTLPDPGNLEDEVHHNVGVADELKASDIERCQSFVTLCERVDARNEPARNVVLEGRADLQDGILIGV
jgi:hypothetical protein